MQTATAHWNSISINKHWQKICRNIHTHAFNWQQNKRIGKQQQQQQQPEQQTAERKNSNKIRHMLCYSCHTELNVYWNLSHCRRSKQKMCLFLRWKNVGDISEAEHHKLVVRNEDRDSDGIERKKVTEMYSDRTTDGRFWCVNAFASNNNAEGVGLTVRNEHSTSHCIQ